jgi:hypothetical protein
MAVMVMSGRDETQRLHMREGQGKLDEGKRATAG